MSPFKFRSFERHWPDLGSTSILITGGTGSFGRAFARLLLARGVPRRLVVFSRDQHPSKPEGRAVKASDTTLLRRAYPGFRQTVSLDEGLRRMVGWYRATFGVKAA